jgi:hypothetical protein
VDWEGADGEEEDSEEGDDDYGDKYMFFCGVASCFVC